MIVDNFFVKETYCSKRSATKRLNSLEDDDEQVKYVDVGKHLTIAEAPILKSAERSRFK